MKKLNLNNLYESHLPPERVDILWADKDAGTGDLKAIHRFKNGSWEPYMVSTEYMEPDDNQEPDEIVYHSEDIASWGSVYTLKDTTNNYKHHCLVISAWGEYSRLSW